MADADQPSNCRIAFVSSNEAWGGSEELWSRAALSLARAGASVSVYKPCLNDTPAVKEMLRSAGCKVADLYGPAWLPRKARTVASLFWKIFRAVRERRFAREFRRQPPAVVVISQGLNYDGGYVGATCRRLGLAYVLISQKASDLYWPPDQVMDELRSAYVGAAAALFVSEHNRTLTEEQLGLRLENARIVRNPFNAQWCSEPAWPGEEGGMRLACVARLDAREKGQDLLFRVLAKEKWRKRPVRLFLFGSGHNEQGLRGMARLLGLSNVSFEGFVEDPAIIWTKMHGLVLPSRCEGLPLSMIEAMLSGRVVIATDVGGNAEVLEDGVTGFLAGGPTEDELDHALERAWERRLEWRSIGAAAAQHARTIVEPDPANSLAALVREIASQKSSPFRGSRVGSDAAIWVHGSRDVGLVATSGMAGTRGSFQQ